MKNLFEMIRKMNIKSLNINFFMNVQTNKLPDQTINNSFKSTQSSLCSEISYEESLFVSILIKNEH